MRFVWRIFIIFVLAIFVKSAFFEETSAYISSPEVKPWIQRVEWKIQDLQNAAQDLPASIEITIRRIFNDVKPQIEAKLI